MKWISALNLEQWAATNSARSIFPALIGDLIRGSATSISSFRFPSGDKGQVRGFDGQLDAEGSPPFVPDGKSIWEFGVTPDAAGKSDRDIKKRTDQVSDRERAETTIVFVTPQTWNNPQKKLPDYLSELKKNYVWKDILYIDGAQLEDWLGHCPAVAARYARFELKLVPAEGARSTEEFWDEYSNRFSPQLTERVLLCGREQQAIDVVRRLSEGQDRVRLMADSPDEAIAFSIAAIRQAEPAVRLFIESRTLVLDTAEAGRLLSGPGRIFIPRSQGMSVSGLLASKSSTILAIGRDQPDGEHEVLRRPSFYDLAKAVETMGYGNDEALDLAKRCGRSITILERQIPGGGAITPEWLPAARQIIPAILAGGWDTTNKSDLAELQELAGDQGYDELERALRQEASRRDPPLDVEGRIWKVRAPVDAFVHSGHLLTSADLIKLGKVCTRVFSVLVRPPDPHDLFDRTMREEQRYSDWLRDGLATTLLQLALLHTQARVNVGGVDPKRWVEELVGALPGLNGDARLISSLRSNLPVLMEAAPRPLLAALEHLLEGEAAKGQLFWDGDVLFGPTSPHVYVLWALERMAWDPSLLVRIALLIARMAELAPDGYRGNTPLGSLRSIFLAWSPNTYASVATRMYAVDQINSRYPEIGWRLLCELLPRAQDTNSPNAKPRFREAGASEGEKPTRLTVSQAYQAVVDRVLDLARGRSDRISKVIEEMYNWADRDLDRALALVEQHLASGHDTLVAWNSLRDLATRHKQYEDAEWTLPKERIEQIEEILDRYQPKNLFERLGWLFADYWVEVAAPIEEREERLAQLRAAAVAEILAEGGDQAILAFADQVRRPDTLSYGLTPCLAEMEDFERFLRLSLGRGGDPQLSFSQVLSGQAEHRFGPKWFATVGALKNDRLLQLSDDVLVRMMLSWSDQRGVWDFVDALGASISEKYWSQKRSFSFSGETSDLLRGVEAYLKVNRPSAALAFVFRRLRDVPSPLLIKVLDDLVSELNRSSDQDNMTIHLVTQALSALRERPDVDVHQLAKLEYAYLPALGDRNRPLTIDRLLSSDPSFYMSVIESVFRADDDVPSEETPSEQDRAKWRANYSLLSDFKLVPGLADGSVNYDVLSNWVSDVRALATASKRAAITDQYIGHLLAHSPDEGEAWPHSSVSRVIDEISSEEIDRGFAIECHNKRGVVTKSVFEGGGQERQLAERYHNWAKRATYPRTAALLESIAASWEENAKSEDSRARQDMMRE